MRRIPDYVLESALLHYRNGSDAQEGRHTMGSGFLVGVKSKSNPAWGHVYAVTAAHVIFDAKAPVVRRIEDGSPIVDVLGLEDWTRHPDGHDVAVCYLGARNDYNSEPRAWIDSDSFVSEADVGHIEGHPKHGVFGYGPGDQALMIGCFVSQEGEWDGRVSLRTGTISLNPEQSDVRLGNIERASFLIEMRSIGGYSGAAVFGAKSGEMLSGVGRASYMGSFPDLIGVDWGHIHRFVPLYERVTGSTPHRFQRTSDKMYVKENTGMTGVTPAWKILELLELEAVRVVRESENFQATERLADGKATLDTSTSESSSKTARSEFIDSLGGAGCAPNQDFGQPRTGRA